jgi:hypothetical protein
MPTAAAADAMPLLCHAGAALDDFIQHEGRVVGERSVACAPLQLSQQQLHSVCSIWLQYWLGHKQTQRLCWAQGVPWMPADVLSLRDVEYMRLPCTAAPPAAGAAGLASSIFLLLFITAACDAML